MKKTLFYLFMVVALISTAMNTWAHHQDDFPGIKRYENLAVFSGSGITLSWTDTHKVPLNKIMGAVDNENLSLISMDEDLGILVADDSRGNMVIMIDGKDELLRLSFLPGEVKRPYNLLEFKVEDGIISEAQFSYIKKVVIERSQA